MKPQNLSFYGWNTSKMWSVRQMVYPIIEFRKYTHASFQKSFKNQFSVKLKDAESLLTTKIFNAYLSQCIELHWSYMYLAFEFASWFSMNFVHNLNWFSVLLEYLGMWQASSVWSYQVKMGPKMRTGVPMCQPE